MTALTLVYDGSSDQAITSGGGSINYGPPSGVNIPAGSNAIVLLAGYGVTGVSDSAGNTYTLAGQDNITDLIPLSIWTCPHCLALTGGSIIVAGSGLDFWGWIAYATGYNNGVNRVASNDDGSGRATSASVTIGTLAQPNELIVTLLANNSTNFTTESSGFTSLVNAVNKNGFSFDIAFQAVTSTTSLTYAPTWSGVGQYDCLVVTFKGVGSGGNFGIIFG